MGFRDMDLDDQVRAALRKDRNLSLNAIQVSVRNGIVYIRGNVNPRDRDYALDIIRHVESVAAIVDQTQATADC